MESEEPQKTVLVVDDDENILALLEICLASKFSVKTARSGQEALRIANECCPDLLLLDLMMPVMDGRQVCQELRSSIKTSDIPVILLSAKEERDECLSDPLLQILGYIPKPFDPDELVRRVSRYLS